MNYADCKIIKVNGFELMKRVNYTKFRKLCRLECCDTDQSLCHQNKVRLHTRFKTYSFCSAFLKVGDNLWIPRPFRLNLIGIITV